MHMTPKITIWGECTQTEKPQLQTSKLALKTIGHAGLYFSLRCHTVIYSSASLRMTKIVSCQSEQMGTGDTTFKTLHFLTAE